MKCYLVTGTDTSVGKTFISGILLNLASSMGYKTAGFKPIASGIKKKKGGKIYNSDVLFLKKNSSIELTEKEVNVFSFTEETSPYIASIINNRKISTKTISKHFNFLKKKANLIIIEGVGGWYTPITKTKTFADWVKTENLPIILIVYLKTGCINHAILTKKAIKNDNLNLVGWIANNFQKKKLYHKEYLIDLKKRLLPTKLLGIVPFLKNKKNIAENIKYINFQFK
ncbi:dethiobiotin synthase [Candidatus Tachikawaea gelatinosa]|uniref:ATP-dependent dethiobiotin synthetase BioD n=1 Tax=Candidatus Tachikawaea gelatinosa TaxID=1410383 RepID=A0A090ALU1_9ENTR|nr:dethiobiotin synthase [Candidatus Tachikawaea gelatinosa]BAP58624.1 ATP-dependent dethiobiotin synthetase BioD [Candidatus Tachikawaea gelatinosa]